ncbi:MAG: hypothetical protein IKE23_01390 [Exiguobacterium sp.]|nr:hypothetical protein [Exiguobacterium sp.]
MSDLRFVGMVLVAVSLICFTVLAREWLIIQAMRKRREENAQKERAATREQRFQNQYEALWMEEKAKRIKAEQEVMNLKNSISRMEDTMGKVKIADLKEYRNAN